MDTLLDRFCRYVRVETTAVEETTDYPSSPGQRTLAGILADELRALGLKDVEVTPDALVLATVPGNVPGASTIAWFAHMDTSPESSGKDVQPQIIRNFDGRDITLPGDTSKIIRVAETPGLADLRGKTLITTDGHTLLGADDKAGVAVIMTAVAELLQRKDVRHGPIRVVFTCDEEVGRGVDKVDLKKVGAAVGYTLDGEGAGTIEAETFSADLAVVTITGVNIHPGFAKDRMVNAIRLAGAFLERLPRDLAPERTADRDGFVHPYVIDGGVPETRIRVLLRSFETADLAKQADVLRKAAAEVVADHPRGKINVDVKPQYRNMRDHLAKEPRAVALATQAFERIGVKPRFASVRGGTDGSRLSELGLPTPNLSTGMHNFHSPLEFACLEEMETAVRMLVELASLWAEAK